MCIKMLEENILNCLWQLFWGDSVCREVQLFRFYISAMCWVCISIHYFCDQKFSNVFIFYFWLCWIFTAAQGLSLVVVSGGYSPVAGHRFLIAGASHCEAQAPEHRLTVVSQGLSCSHTWDLLEPGSSATLTSYIRTESEGYEGDVCYWCLAGKEGDPSQMVRPPDFLMGLPRGFI